MVNISTDIDNSQAAKMEKHLKMTTLKILPKAQTKVKVTTLWITWRPITMPDQS